MMFAVFWSGGKQHRVIEGEVVRLERLDVEPGGEVVFDKVLMVGEGADVAVGAPYLEGRQIKGEVVRQMRGRKIRIIKFKRRTNYLRRAGHRQHYTDVRITSIGA